MKKKWKAVLCVLCNLIIFLLYSVPVFVVSVGKSYNFRASGTVMKPDGMTTLTGGVLTEMFLILLHVFAWYKKGTVKAWHAMLVLLAFAAAMMFFCLPLIL